MKLVKQQEEESKLFFGGLPTDIEMAKLREAYPESKMSSGDFFPYSDIEKLIELEWKSTRFRSVTNRWRRVVEGETNIFIHPDPGKGFKVLTEPEKLALSGKKFGSAGKIARRSFVIGSRVDRKALSENELTALDHLASGAAKIHAAAQIKRQLELPKI